MEKLELLCIVGENAKWYSHYGNGMAVPQNLNKITTIPLLGIHPKELKAGVQRDICTPVFIAALFTVAKRRKQPKCPSKDKWINKMWYIQWNIIQP